MAGLGLPGITPSSSPPPLVVPVPPPPSSSLKVTAPDPPSSDPPDDDVWESTQAHSSQPHTVVSPPQSRMTEPDAVVEEEDAVENTSEEKAPDSTPTAVTNSVVPPNAIRPPFESRVEDDEDSVTRVGPPPSTQKD